AYDHSRGGGGRAAGAPAGAPAGEARAKEALLRWRLHALLAGLTGGLHHFYEAVLASPDIPTTRAALGCALARAGRFAEAVPHLRAATGADPFDRPAARALHAALGELGDGEGQRAFAREQRLLAKAVPQAAPREPWSAEAAPPRPPPPPAPAPVVPRSPARPPAPAEPARAAVAELAPAAGRPLVSLAMIVRDEEHNLPDCLGGLRELFDEI